MKAMKSRMGVEYPLPHPTMRLMYEGDLDLVDDGPYGALGVYQGPDATGGDLRRYDGDFTPDEIQGMMARQAHGNLLYGDDAHYVRLAPVWGEPEDGRGLLPVPPLPPIRGS